VKRGPAEWAGPAYETGDDSPESSPFLFGRPTVLRLPAAAAASLNRRAGDGAEGAKDAAVGSHRSEREAALLAVVGNDAEVLRHAFLLAVTAVRASKYGVELHGRLSPSVRRRLHASSGAAHVQQPRLGQPRSPPRPRAECGRRKRERAPKEAFDALPFRPRPGGSRLNLASSTSRAYGAGVLTVAQPLAGAWNCTMLPSTESVTWVAAPEL